MIKNNDNFAEFNRMAREVMGYPIMRYQDVKQSFAEITTALDQAIDQILRVTTYVEDNLCYHLAEIMLSGIKTKKLYRGRWDKTRESVGEGVEIGAENIRILGTGFDMFKLSRLHRDAAFLPVKRIIRTARLNNSVYEQIVTSFANATQQYCDVVDALAGASVDLAEGAATIQQFQKISDLIDRKQLIENLVSCVDPNRLYGVVALVQRLYRLVYTKQSEIVKAHLRLILKIVRSTTYQDTDAMEAFQAGSLGLLHAVSVFDYRNRTAFPTFARQWIRQRVTVSRRSGTGPLIRIPFAIWEQYSAIQAKERELNQQYPEGIPDGLLASQLSLAPDVVQQVQDFVRASYVTQLDDDLRLEDGATTKVAQVPDEQLQEQAEQEEIRQELMQIVQHLTPEQRKILCLRFGILEGIENEIDPREKLRELYRQLAGKIMVASHSQERDAEPLDVSLDTDER